MNIALVIPPVWSVEFPPISIALLTAILRKKGHQVFVFDINSEIYHSSTEKERKGLYSSCGNFVLEQINREDFLMRNKKINELIERILNTEAKVIGFSCYYTTQEFCFKMAELIKERDGSRKIIFGGPQCARNEVLYKRSSIDENRYRNVDVVVTTEGDEILPQIVEQIESKGYVDFCSGTFLKKDGKMIDCGRRPVIKNLDDLPFADFTDFSLDMYTASQRIGISVNRGCIWRCKYCSAWQFFGRHRSMSGERVFAEIEHQVKTLGSIKTIRFCDDVLNGNIESLNRFCEVMIERRKKDFPKILWDGDAVIRKEMTKELLNKMALAGCVQLGYGLESGSQDVINAMGKNFSISTAQQLIRDTHEVGINVDLNIMVGYPNETEEDFEKTLDFIKRYREHIYQIRLTEKFCLLLENSYMYKYPEEFNIKPYPDTEFWETTDGKNNYDIRIKRYKKLIQLISSLGVYYTSRAESI